MSTNPNPSREPLVLYDVELVRVDPVKQRLTFRHGGCALVLCAGNVATWPAGAIGRLTLHASAFIADVCGICDSFVQPREDGYTSLGSDERDFAKAYWLWAHGRLG